jgi:arylsulfatase A-like enzyme
MRRLRLLVAFGLVFFPSRTFAASLNGADRPNVTLPNFILIVCDNLGYGDIGCFGSKLHRTPHVDRMAGEGMRFTDFYVTSGVCTPSRASIMTGCYPRRVNMHMDEPRAPVLAPVSPLGLHPNEITIAEILKKRGYATATIGKWHLGDQLPFLPTRQGFDCYFGIPYSEDMTTEFRGPACPPLPLMENERVIETLPDLNLLTKRYTRKAVEFLKTHQHEPFFVYLPHVMPGSLKPSFASEQFRGKSANGVYGDAVEELDWSAGQILRALQELGIDDRTLVIWPKTLAKTSATSTGQARTSAPPAGFRTRRRDSSNRSRDGAQAYGLNGYRSK